MNKLFLIVIIPHQPYIKDVLFVDGARFLKFNWMGRRLLGRWARFLNETSVVSFLFFILWARYDVALILRKLTAVIIIRLSLLDL